MKIFDRDRPLLLEFIKREAEDYRWGGIHPVDGSMPEERREAFIQKTIKQIEDNIVKYPKCNYLHIQSISNIGMVCRTLSLSVDGPLDFRFDINLCLPPNPRNGVVSSTLVERK